MLKREEGAWEGGDLNFTTTQTASDGRRNRAKILIL
jgi:hypothetical protein